jgi:Protein of unknown function (DUF1488)
VAIEYASVQIVRKPARSLSHRQPDRFQPMIEFPNHSRSYDRTRHAVRFWGHDSAMEASFFINEDALRRIQPDARLDESGFLSAFDSNRDLICAAAARVYVRGSRGSYDLVAAHFWSELGEAEVNTLFDHLVGATKQCRWNFEVERFRGFNIDCQ